LSYKKWYEDHAQKHADILKTLSHLSQEEVIEYFDFDHMKIKHPEFCPFRFDDDIIRVEDGKNLYSYCSIESKNSAKFETKDSIHNDCSNCKVPHKPHVIKKYFDRDWRVVMKDCDSSILHID